MKVAANKIDEYLDRSLDKVKAVLLYGPDVGLISERADKVATKILGADPDPFLLIRLDNKKLLEDKGSLEIEANSISLMPGRKLIIVSDAGNSLAGEVEETLENLKSDSFILIKAGDLAASAKLRKLAESREDILAAPCYVDDQQSLTNIVRQKLNENGYQFPPELPQYIASFFSGNRLLVKVELEKLFLYLDTRKEITVADIDKIICSSKEENFQEITNAVANKDFNSAEKIIKQHIKQGLYPVTIIRALINYYSRLLIAKGEMDNGMNSQMAMASLRPPVFFKQKAIMANHLTLWHLKEIKNFLQLLERLEILFKSETAYFAEIILLGQLQKILQRKLSR